MSYYVLKHEQLIPRPLREVFSFFEKPENLSLITPPSLDFQIVSERPITMEKGTRINYRIRVLGLPLRWQSLITAYEPPFRFIDEQTVGPYAYWQHRHEFKQVEGGTLIEDEVKYALPGGPFAPLINRFLVKKDLDRIFNFRRKAVEGIFNRIPYYGGTSMKIVIAGGSGFIGKALIRHLQQAGHRVIVLTRKPVAQQPPQAGPLLYEHWDAKTAGPWINQIDGADAVINLSGEPIAAKRWTTAQKNKIVASRIEAAEAIIDAISRAKKKPSVLVNASAVGYYGNVPFGNVTENADKGTGFLADTCEQWEKTALRAGSSGVRVVLARIGIVLEKGGGALAKMLPPFYFFAGGSLGSGKQWLPWIHIEDAAKALLYAVENQGISGPMNLTAPEPVTMREFCSSLGKVIGRPSWAPVPAFALKMLLGEMSDMLLEGQKAVPEKLLKSGFRFQYPEIQKAIEAAVHAL